MTLWADLREILIYLSESLSITFVDNPSKECVERRSAEVSTLVQVDLVTYIVLFHHPLAIHLQFL